MVEITEIIKKYAVENAINYGKAQSKSVLGKVLSEEPSLRQHTESTLKEVDLVVSDVNKMSREDLQACFATYGFDNKKECKRGILADLPNVRGKVVMRFAPNPSGPLHIGHARSVTLNDEYVKKYGGKLILRIEDTDPKRVEKDAYHMIEEDLRWLGVNISEQITQSSRLAVYRDFAVKLIKKEGAYVCSCGQKKFKKFKDSAKNCPCRSNDLQENINRWNKMQEGESGLVLNIKTDMAHQNPALRDYPIMRIAHERHPLTGRDWDLYPLMNFSVTIDDHLSGITHVLRGKDHIVNTQRQLFIYDYFGWVPPEFIHNGLLQIKGVNLSTSTMKEGIENGTYHGWGDPKLGTLRALKKRGIQPEAIRTIMKAMGIGDADVTFDWQNLYAENKKIVEEKANRYFFVPDPEEIWVKQIPKEADIIKVPLHPDHPHRGYRDIEVKKGNETTKLFLAKKDLKDLKKGDVLRLKNFCNIKIEETRPIIATYMKEKDLKSKIVQWLPEDYIGCEVIGSDKKTAGFCERECKYLEQGDIIQFERFGFCRVSRVDPDGLRCYFAHN